VRNLSVEEELCSQGFSKINLRTLYDSLDDNKGAC